jgi:tripartite-type tricarboxylate transporter receptor subunit TctC
MRRRDILAGGAGLAVGLAAPALAQSWPQQSIRMVIPYTPGGATDAMARLTAQKLAERLGVNVTPENRAGGNGTVGGMAVVQAPADGSTILFTASIHVMARQVMKAPPYDPLADFTPVARVGRGPLLLVAPPRLPQGTIEEVVAAARREPAKWTFAVSSLGSAGHLATLEFNRLAGLDIPVAPYRGSAPGLADVAAGNMQLMLDPILATLPLARGGQVKALAITTAKRSVRTTPSRTSSPAKAPTAAASDRRVISAPS